MTLQITGNNMTGSPELVLSAGSSVALSWSPFGSGVARTGATASLLGFNGERQDPLTGTTHLGNGYRAYNPALRRFTCPDSESPFGVGGINPYVYCDSDPTNNIDPDGHMPRGLNERRNAMIFDGKIKLPQASGASSALPLMDTRHAGTASAEHMAKGQYSEELQRRVEPAPPVPVAEPEPELSDYYKAPAFLWAVDSNHIQRASNNRINISEGKSNINRAKQDDSYLRKENTELNNGLSAMKGLTEKTVSDKLNNLILTTGRPPHPSVTLYRGMPSSYLSPVGSLAQTNRFISTTADYSVALKFYNRRGGSANGGALIKVVGGKPLYIPNVYYGVSGDESEYLYPRNTKFRVSQDPNTRMIVYTVEE